MKDLFGEIQLARVSSDCQPFVRQSYSRFSKANSHPQNDSASYKVPRNKRLQWLRGSQTKDPNLGRYQQPKIPIPEQLSVSWVHRTIQQSSDGYHTSSPADAALV